jgi:hypothetical protein
MVASEVVIGGELFQVLDNNERATLGYASRTLKPPERHDNINRSIGISLWLQ